MVNFVCKMLSSRRIIHNTLVEFLTAFLNYLISVKKVSAVLKEGTLTPIFKKGDTCDTGNYREITVTSVLLKILEHILNARHNEIFLSTQSRLQRGFTEGCSSINAAVILTECVLESSNNKQDMWLTTLGAQKAFDVVDHGSLLRQLYLDGIKKFPPCAQRARDSQFSLPKIAYILRKKTVLDQILYLPLSLTGSTL